MNININVTITKENAHPAEAGRAKTYLKPNYISNDLLHEFLMWFSYRGFVTTADVIKAGYRLDTFFEMKKELERKGWVIRKRVVDGVARYSLGGRK